MKIIADTNVLLRAVLPDEGQQEAARKVLASADQVAISLHALCEFVWVMSRSYRAPRHEIGASLRLLLDTDNVVVDRPAVAAGLALLDAGGDFADGVIAFEGDRLGGDVFVSFDRRAVKLVRGSGRAARLLT